jgi:hypothetical protein
MASRVILIRIFTCNFQTTGTGSEAKSTSVVMLIPKRVNYGEDLEKQHSYTYSCSASPKMMVLG